MITYPKPDLIPTWQEWARRLILVLVQRDTKPFRSEAVSFSNLSGGECEVKSPAVSATCIILLVAQTEPLGVLWEDKSLRVNGKSFVIKSTNSSDTPDVGWFIVEPI